MMWLRRSEPEVEQKAQPERRIIMEGSRSRSCTRSPHRPADLCFRGPPAPTGGVASSHRPRTCRPVPAVAVPVQREEPAPAAARAAPGPRRITLSVKEAAEALGVSERMVHELVATRRIQSLQVGRRRLFPEISIDEYLRSTIARAAGK